MRTPEEIATEIATLKKMKEGLRVKVSKFGDNHENAIDAQIQVLEDKMTEDQVCDDHDNACEDEPFFADNEFDNAVEAARWLWQTDSEEEEAPSDAWKSLQK